MLTVKSISGSLNEKPKVSNLIVTNFESKTIDIEYKVEDVERTICRHYLLLNGNRMEITKAVGYESTTNVYKYQIGGLTRDTTYTIQIRASDGHDEGLSLAIRQKTKNLELYGVRVDETNSNPSTSVTYIEGAVGVSPATPTSLGGWFNKFPFNKIRIVGMKNGVVTKEINPNNKAMYTDGYYVPTDVDVMVEFPKFYWKWTKTTTGYELRICDQKLEGFDCYAHKKNGIEKDFLYVGVYPGFEEAGKLRSKSGVIPTISRRIGYFRNLARANGTGYSQAFWFKREMLRVLYLIAYKNLNSRLALGQGQQDGAIKATGGCNTKGLIYGSQDKNEQMCFLGIEELWGGLGTFLEGIFIEYKTIYINLKNTNFNESLTQNDILGTFSDGNFLESKWGWLKSVHHSNKSGFFPKETGGSDTTYYCDYSQAISQVTGPGNPFIARTNHNTGIFSTVLNLYQDGGTDRTCARLCYL